MTDIIVPKVGLTVEEIEVTEWLVSVGDEVTAGQVVVVVNADKTDVEVGSEVDGTITSIAATAGEAVAVGGLLAKVAAPGEARDPVAEPIEPTAANEDTSGDGTVHPEPGGAPRTTETPVTHPTGDSDPRPRAGRVLASPLARRLAAATGLSIADIPGSGPAGRVVRRDVERLRSSGLADASARTSALRASADAAEALGVTAQAASTDARSDLTAVIATVVTNAIRTDSAADSLLPVHLARSVELDELIELPGGLGLRGVCDAIEVGRPAVSATGLVVLATTGDGFDAIDSRLPTDSAALLTVGPLEWSSRRRYGELVERPRFPVTLRFDIDRLRPVVAARVLRSVAMRLAGAGDLLAESSTAT